MKCSFCGYEFKEKEGSCGCRGCPSGGRCGKIKCPRCNYEMVRESGLVKWLKGREKA